MRAFSRFELASAYRGRVLVAMPNGIGLSRRGRSLSTAGGGQPRCCPPTRWRRPDALASRARRGRDRAGPVRPACRLGPGREPAQAQRPTAGSRARASQRSPVASGAGPLPWIAAACALVALATPRRHAGPPALALDGPGHRGPRGRRLRGADPAGGVRAPSGLDGRLRPPPPTGRRACGRQRRGAPARPVAGGRAPGTGLRAAVTRRDVPSRRHGGGGVRC